MATGRVDQGVAYLIPNQSVGIGRKVAAFVRRGSFTKTDASNLEPGLSGIDSELIWAVDLIVDYLVYQTQIFFHLLLSLFA